MQKECCEAGHIWTGQPAGSEGVVGGVAAYFAKPSGATTKAAVLISDAFGYKRVNVRLIGDEFARAGYLVVVPDLFDGDVMTEDDFPNGTAHDWFGRHPVGSDKTTALLHAVISELRLVHGVEHVVTEGFCWGGWYAVKLAATDKVAAATVAHGSILQLENIEPIRAPTQFLNAEVDPQWPDEFTEGVQKILDGKDFPTQLKQYPGTTHGFTIRGAWTGTALEMLEDEAELHGSTTHGANEAAKDTIAWWDRHTGGGAPTAA